MLFVAKLYHDIRTAERYPVSLDGTLRNAQAEPQDVVIDDLSATGFRTTATHGVEIGDEITLGVFGVGLRTAHVLRESNGGYGYQFQVPLTQNELASALCGLKPPEPIRFPGVTAAHIEGPAPAADPEWSLSSRMRVLTIATIAVAPWILLGICWIGIA